MRRPATTWLLGLALGAAACCSAIAASRGVQVELKASAQPGAPFAGAVKLYDASYALVIGIDNYSDGWPRLSNAVRDARRIADALKQHGFEVSLKENLRSNALKQSLEEFFVLKGDNENARLLVWFAGHGHTLGSEGFVVPADAPKPSAAAQFRLRALSLRRFGEYVRLARSKHALVIFDSCFAGTVFDSQRALPPAAVTRATTLPVRQFLTSGDAGQTVSDDGTFRTLFLRALEGGEGADANDDGYLTASELGMFLSNRVTNLTLARQTPRYGKLRDKDFDQGDFVFVLPGARTAALAAPAPPPAPAPKTNTAVEITFWNSVKDSKNPRALEAYLNRYPAGVFAALAGIRIGDLRKPAATSAPPTAPAPEPTTSRLQADVLSAPKEDKIAALAVPQAPAGSGNFDGRYGGTEKQCSSGSIAWHLKVAGGLVTGRALYKLGRIEAIYPVEGRITPEGKLSDVSAKGRKRIELKGTLGNVLSGACGQVELSKDGFDQALFAASPHTPLDAGTASLGPFEKKDIIGSWSDRCISLFSRRMVITDGGFEFRTARYSPYDDWSLGSTDFSGNRLDLSFGFFGGGELSFERVGVDTLRVARVAFEVPKKEMPLNQTPVFFAVGAILERCD